MGTSIYDEAFVDLTGVRRSFHGSYGMIAHKMQEVVEAELGLTVSVGLSITKVLAKIGSKHKKPHGLTISMSYRKGSGNTLFNTQQARRQRYKPSTREKEGMYLKE